MSAKPRSDSALPLTDIVGEVDQSAPPRILLVIPTMNEAAHIERLLSELLADASDLPRLRIVVADGGSTDETTGLVERIARTNPRVSLVHNPGRIQSAGVNLAVRRFGRGSDILLRYDAHSTYPKGYCKRLVATLDRMKADAVVVPMDSTGRSCLQRAVAAVSNSLIGTGGAAHRAGHRSGFVDHGHHAAFRMQTFVKLGGYDESFSHNEDAELDCRQRSLGHTIYLNSEIRIRYEPRSTAEALWRQYFRYGAGRSRTVRRHPGSARLRQMLVPSHVVVSLLAVAFSPVLPLLLLWPLAYLAALALISLWFALAARSACLLLCGAAAAIMHFAWGLGFLTALVTRRETVWDPSELVPLKAGDGS